MGLKSQICTTREQSERLLKLGLKKEIADMYYTNASLPFIKDEFHLECKSFKELSNNLSEISPFTFIPAWSLHRLIEMLPIDIIVNDTLFYFVILNNMSFQYENPTINRVVCSFNSKNLYECAIDCIEWLIKNKHLDPQFLEDKQWQKTRSPTKNCKTS